MATFDSLPAIFPGHVAPVVRFADDGDRELVNLSWGFVSLIQGKSPRRVTNARDDNLSSGFWKDSFQNRRCLVPASSFSEPKGLKPATWHWFALTGDEPRPGFSFAGIWRKWKGPLKKDSEPVEQDVFAFLTTTPNELVGSINHERMPVLLSGDDDFQRWLTGTTAEAFALVKPFPSERMRIVQSGFDKLDKLEP